MIKNMSELKTLVLSVIITVGCIATLLFIAIHNFRPTDPVPQIYTIKPTLKKDLPWGIPIVKPKFVILDIPTMDPNQNIFVANAIISFKFDPTLISLETISHFIFEKGKILDKKGPFLKIQNNLTIAEYHVKIEFSNTLNYNTFPLDDHQISLVLTNLFAGPQELIFITTQSDLVIAQRLKITGWQYATKNVSFGYTAVEDTNNISAAKHPCVLYSIGFKKKNLGDIFTIFIPLIIMFFISLICYLTKQNVMSFSIQNLVAILTYRYIIQKIAPRTGYLTTGDIVYTYCLIIIILTLSLNLWSIQSKKNRQKIFKIMPIVIPIACFVLIMLVFYTLFIRV